MVVHDVLRRSLKIRGCSECEANITINHEDATEVDQHHVLAFSDGAGSAVGQEYATYTFCSVACLKEHCETYFQRMLEDDAEDPETGDQTESEEIALRSEG